MSGQGGPKVRLGVAGLGTVGQGLVRLVAARPAFAPGGGQVEVTAVSARRRDAARGVDLRAMTWFDDPVALARSSEIDIFIELIGGAEGPARESVVAALEAGKPVVTANKALIAHHGAELARLAEARGVALRFEAAVMGGAPAVKVLREALVGDQIDAVAGILNGTCNYILTEMEAEGLDFARALAQAQGLGYAEADPSTDIGGYDAAHKIVILAALAFGGAPDWSRAEVEGIEKVELIDIRLAGALGFRIKLVALARRAADGVSVSVHPTLLPLEHPLARADGALNALFIHAQDLGELFIQGAGAGAGPTAMAVAADIADVLAQPVRPVFQTPADRLAKGAPAPSRKAREGAYMRL
ncbi:MAG: homoserine dehydrogenase, partial [Alphaproteobacteria bacterium]|nr:homoserine dehydrogenase [Alphaproteobacteria bacterium]